MEIYYLSCLYSNLSSDLVYIVVAVVLGALDSHIRARYSNNYQLNSPMSHISIRHDYTLRRLSLAAMNLERKKNIRICILIMLLVFFVNDCAYSNKIK